MQIRLSTSYSELRRAAWRALRNNPAGGVDLISGAEFRKGLEGRLHRMRRQLHAGKYRLSGLRKARITTRSGKVRDLQIPTVQDRVVARLLLAMLASVDQSLPDHVLCRRDGIGQRQAIQTIAGVRETLPWTLTMDIADAFSSADVDAALAALAKRCRSQQVLKAVDAMMSVAHRHGPGLPQGHPLSTLLLNLYLAPLDQALKGTSGLSYRYIDDIVVLASSEAEVLQARQSLESVLGELGMVAHPDKTHVVEPEEPVAYLGFAVSTDGSIDASAGAVGRLMEALKGETHEEQKQHLVGWLGYFARPARHGRRVGEIYNLLAATQETSRWPLANTVINDDDGGDEQYQEDHGNAEAAW